MSGSDLIGRLVRRLGGQNETARLVKCRQSEVWRWVKQNRVPSSRIQTLIDVAAKLDPPVHLTMSDFFEMSAQLSATEPARAA